MSVSDGKYPDPHDIVIVNNVRNVGTPEAPREVDMLYSVVIDGEYMACIEEGATVEVSHTARGLNTVRVPFLADRVRTVTLDEFTAPPAPKKLEGRAVVETWTSTSSSAKEKYRFRVRDLGFNDVIGTSAGGYSNRKFRDKLAKRFATAFECEVRELDAEPAE